MNLIQVKVKTNSKKPGIAKVSESEYHVAVSALPVGGKANEAVLSALADYLHIPQSLIRLKKGMTSKNKFFEINK